MLFEITQNMPHIPSQTSASTWVLILDGQQLFSCPLGFNSGFSLTFCLITLLRHVLSFQHCLLLIDYQAS